MENSVQKTSEKQETISSLFPKSYPTTFKSFFPKFPPQFSQNFPKQSETKKKNIPQQFIGLSWAGGFWGGSWVLLSKSFGKIGKVSFSSNFYQLFQFFPTKFSKTSKSLTKNCSNDFWRILSGWGFAGLLLRHNKRRGAMLFYRHLCIAAQTPEK